MRLKDTWPRQEALLFRVPLAQAVDAQIAALRRLDVLELARLLRLDGLGFGCVSECCATPALSGSAEAPRMAGTGLRPRTQSRSAIVTRP